MKVKVFDTTEAMGLAAAKHAAEVLKTVITRDGTARLLLSTGASQFPFFKHFVNEDIDWSKVEMFHLDEYVGISPEHPASFQKYLRERFVDVVNPGKYHLINGQADPAETIRELTELLAQRPVDLGLIGIGENGHIAFNDPPADFDDDSAFKVVTLSDTCIAQQIHEGWFATPEDAFRQAISMTCRQIMQCRTIISVVPYAVKAQAIHDTLTQEETNLVPATLMKKHADVTVYCDADSAAMVPQEVLKQYEEDKKMKKICLVGAGLRCDTMFIEHLVPNYGDTIALTGVYDINHTRCEYIQKKVGPGMKIYDDYETMLDTEKPDAVIVTTVDSTHHDYIVRALDRGCDVFSEKPITNTFDRCLAIREAEKRSGKKVAVTFNARFYPYFIRLKELVAGGAIGKIHAVNYDYNLNRSHGGDYFKRWHRKMEFSQGMLLHKSTHHFDIVNWLLEDEPRLVNALGVQSYYANAEKAAAPRCTRCPIRETCTSSGSWNARSSHEIYYAAEHEDSYIRDTCCFLPDADIMDNLSVSVRYEHGALLTYSLNLFSMHEGFRLVLTGETGVLTFETWENWDTDEFQIRILRHDHSEEIFTVKKETGNHGGADERLIAMLFGGQKDELGLCADSFAGFSSAIIGIGANKCMAEGCTVDLKPMLDELR